MASGFCVCFYFDLSNKREIQSSKRERTQEELCWTLSFLNIFQSSLIVKAFISDFLDRTALACLLFRRSISRSASLTSVLVMPLSVSTSPLWFLDWLTYSSPHHSPHLTCRLFVGRALICSIPHSIAKLIIIIITIKGCTCPYEKHSIT